VLSALKEEVPASASDLANLSPLFDKIAANLGGSGVPVISGWSFRLTMSSSSQTLGSSSREREPLLPKTARIMDDSIGASLQDDVISKHVNVELTDENDLKAKQIRENLEKYEQLFGADEDAFDQPTTTRKELWSYYLYYNVRFLLPDMIRKITDQSQGDNGVGPGSYSQALFQYVLTGAGWDPAVSPIQKGNCGSAGCVVAWGSGTRSVASVVLIANGICFAVMTVMFVGLGSAADYGTFGRWLLLVLTVICWVFQYCMMAIRTPNQWPAAMTLYIVAYIAYVSPSNLNLHLANFLRGLLLFSTPHCSPGWPDICRTLGRPERRT
jgi:hypothetical protein